MLPAAPHHKQSSVFEADNELLLTACCPERMLKRVMSNCTGYSTEKAVQRILEVNVNFLAIDFDQTLIDIHTGGALPGTLKELTTHIRPEFRDLLVRVCACAQQLGGLHHTRLLVPCTAHGQ